MAEHVTQREHLAGPLPPLPDGGHLAWQPPGGKAPTDKADSRRNTQVRSHFECLGPDQVSGLGARVTHIQPRHER